jgi:SAM-dependent methyltransferase
MSWDPVWETVYRSRAWGQYPGEDVIRFVKGRFSKAGEPSRARLLEVGCGSGANLWFMAREGFCVHGLDGSETAVGLARDRLERECPGWAAAGGRVQAGDVAQLPYPDGYFDGVLDVVALCYCGFEEAQHAYREMARVVKPGGRLFSRMFARGCWGDETGEAAGRDMWRCAEGPLQGFGGTRFAAEEDVPALLQGWTVAGVERSSFTMQGGQHEIRHLLVEGIKP